MTTPFGGFTRSPALPLQGKGTRLPRLLLITDRCQAEARGRTLAETVAAAVQGRAWAMILREKDLAFGERERLAHELLEVLEGAMLIVASDVALARRLGAAGVHLAAGDPWEVGEDLVVGRSCHDGPELAEAARAGAHYATLSPVFPSPSKPGYGPALGTEGLARLVTKQPGLPVFALGGITPERVRGCLAAGAYGVAVTGAVMGADHPAEIVGALVSELEEQTKEVAR